MSAKIVQFPACASLGYVNRVADVLRVARTLSNPQSSPRPNPAETAAVIPFVREVGTAPSSLTGRMTAATPSSKNGGDDAA
ncbi:MAG: hypothetical protein GC185_01715 [Alphaproteobacteria bacterium]|nr:hypothetical protein [Alphaproteobacteria bacterium]